MKELNRSLAALVPVLAYAAIFAVLSVDVAVRVWDWRARFESAGDVVMLLYLEGIRTLVTLGGITLAAAAMRRARGAPALASLSLAIAFGTVFYTKIIAFRGFPGALQSALSAGLQERDVPSWLLRVVFAHPEWAAWPALGGLLLFAAAWPRRLTAVDIASSGAADRTGALRGVPLAGSDIGSSARTAAARLVERGALTPPRVWTAAAAAGVLHTLLLFTLPAVRPAVHVVFIGVAALVFAICVALLRAGHHVSSAQERRVLVWLRRGGLMAATLFSLSALSALLLPGSALAMVLLSLAPAVLALGLVPAIAAAGRSSPYGVGAPPNT